MQSQFTDAQITLRAGHRSVQSLQLYANIHGDAGRRQQQSILPNSESSTEATAKRQRIESEKSSDDTVSSQITQAVQSVAENAEKLGNITIHFYLGSK